MLISSFGILVKMRKRTWPLNWRAIELPALRGKVGASQEEIASAVGISRQTYSAYENRTRPIPWSLYLALLFYFDYIPSTHYMIRQLELFPNERSYGNKT